MSLYVHLTADTNIYNLQTFQYNREQYIYKQYYRFKLTIIKNTIVHILIPQKTCTSSNAVHKMHN